MAVSLVKHCSYSHQHAGHRQIQRLGQPPEQGRFASKCQAFQAQKPCGLVPEPLSSIILCFVYRVTLLWFRFRFGKEEVVHRESFSRLRVHNLKCCVNIANICEWLGNAGITSSMTLPGAFFNDCGNSSIAFSAFQDDDNNAGGKKSCLKCREQIKLWQRTSQYARFMKWPLMPRQT